MHLISATCRQQTQKMAYVQQTRGGALNCESPVLQAQYSLGTWYLVMNLLRIHGNV